MWFCCQLWQCSFQTCFGPIDVWKAWNGWSHVVHPTKGNSTSKNYLDNATRYRVGESSPRPAVYLERRPNHAWMAAIPHLPESGACDFDVVQGFEQPTTLEGVTRQPTRNPSAQSETFQQQYSSTPSPRPSLIEWESSTPERAPSADWRVLETSLDYWRREHTDVQARCQEEVECPANVIRYNDTGSMEKVNVGHYVDYYTDDEGDMDDLSESEKESIMVQVRRLWELRATLEEEDLSNTSSSISQPTENLAGQQQKGTNDNEENNDETPQTESSLKASPEIEASLSQTSSMDSTSEQFCDENGMYWHFLQLPSYEARRQTYRNLLNWRLRRVENKTSSQETSFDSVDTEDSSTEVSCADDQVPTSFNNTGPSDNVDSTVAVAGQSQAHHSQQLRTDGECTSSEASSAPAPKVSRHHHTHHLPSPSNLEETSSLGASYSKVLQRTLNLSEDSNVSTGQEQECAGPVPEPDVWSGCERPSASVRRREFGRISGEPSSCALHRRYHSLRNHTSLAYARDYSVDEKSDALFREFSRCEPRTLDAPRQRHGIGNHYRRSHTPMIARHGRTTYVNLVSKTAAPKGSNSVEDSKVMCEGDDRGMTAVPTKCLGDYESSTAAEFRS